MSDGMETDKSMCCLGYNPDDELNNDPTLRFACPVEILLENMYTYIRFGKQCKLDQTETQYIDYNANGMYDPEVDEVIGTPEVETTFPGKYLCCQEAADKDDMLAEACIIESDLVNGFYSYR